MALNIKIEKSTLPTYYLLADSVDHMFTRMPIQAPYPSSDKNPSIFGLDLGLCVEQISMHGIVNTDANVGNADDPSKAELCALVRTWWDYGDTPTSLAKLTINSTEVFYGFIKQASFKQAGGVEQRWDFDLIFLIIQVV